MRILPAHIREAKDTAKALKGAMDMIGLTRDRRIENCGPITLQQAQECLAKALGYEAGWKELRIELERPHKPVYLDDLSQDESIKEREKIIGRLAELLGFDYMHGFVCNAIVMAGIGYSAKVRRNLAERSTPWGVIIDKEEIAHGVSSVLTGSHGGYILSLDRQLAMPDHLRLNDVYYEEDTDWALVVLAFPADFHERLIYALATVDVFTGNSIPRLRKDDTDEQEKLLSELFRGSSPDIEDKLNRDITKEEHEVIQFLAECVLSNRSPATSPLNRHPSLQDWVSTLDNSPRLNGKWAKKKVEWKQHWGQWERMEANQIEFNKEMERSFGLLPPDALT